MAFAIGIKAQGSTGEHLRDYWNRFARFEPTPSIAALSYPYCHRNFVHCWNPALIQRYRDEASIE
jgi:hypothetical protein